MSLSCTSCWCGNPELERFSSEYLHCPACETLVLANPPTANALLVTDDDAALYGRNYFERMAERHGLPTLEDRARFDLHERCLYWLRSLLRYRQPPARILELGSAHGAFVALMRWAGFDATGLDLSPELVERARRRFDVPILEGPIESHDLPEGSMDAVVLMDVLEHLAQPEETLRRCFRLLKPDGLFFLQTPQYREGKSLAQMQEEGDPFLRMLLPDQHLYLFSQSSVRLLLQRLGAEHVVFEPAIFSAYDMSLVVSRTVPRRCRKAPPWHLFNLLPRAGWCLPCAISMTAFRNCPDSMPNPKRTAPRASGICRRWKSYLRSRPPTMPGRTTLARPTRLLRPRHPRRWRAPCAISMSAFRNYPDCMPNPRRTAPRASGICKRWKSYLRSRPLTTPGRTTPAMPRAPGCTAAAAEDLARSLHDLEAGNEGRRPVRAERQAVELRDRLASQASIQRCKCFRRRAGSANWEPGRQSSGLFARRH